VGQKVKTQTAIKKDINRRAKVCGRKVEGIYKARENKKLK
jgi:hypothetical protein